MHSRRTRRRRKANCNLCESSCRKEAMPSRSADGLVAVVRIERNQHLDRAAQMRKQPVVLLERLRPASDQPHRRQGGAKPAAKARAKDRRSRPGKAAVTELFVCSICRHKYPDAGLLLTHLYTHL